MKLNTDPTQHQHLIVLSKYSIKYYFYKYVFNCFPGGFSVPTDRWSCRLLDDDPSTREAQDLHDLHGRLCWIRHATGGLHPPGHPPRSPTTLHPHDTLRFALLLH